MKKMLSCLAAILLAAVFSTCACAEGENSVLHYHFADREEAVACYLSNTEYFDSIGPRDIQYKTNDKNGTVEVLKEFGAAQMMEFSDEEKAAIESALAEMEADLESGGYTLPELEEITMIRSTQHEESDSGAYTHKTQIYLGQDVTDLLCSEDKETREFGKSVLWHEIFHCLTRSNPDFRKDMYGIIHFTVQDQEYAIPPSVFEQFITNPDVEHHNAFATFKINGEDIDCFAALIATEPFEKEGDSFFDCEETALVPVDGSDAYYVPEDAENFWDVFGRNTEYVIDPEECMADNFSFAMTYGPDGTEYENPEMIEAILTYLS